MPLNKRLPSGVDFQNIVAEAFRKAGWRVLRQPADRGARADLVVQGEEKKYAVQVKSASEGRSDRLIPLLSQAILEIQAFVRNNSGDIAPLAVVGAKHIPATVADHIKQFVERNAPNMAVGVVDAEGFRSFVGPGLQGLNADPLRQIRSTSQGYQLPDLFSDLGQWMLKILLGRELPESFISAPRGPIANASQLAALADVSIMSASRFVNRLEKEGFLDEHNRSFRIVRTDELLEQWVSATRYTSHLVPARYIVKQDESQLFASVERYAVESNPEHRKPRASRGILKRHPRVCVALFAAAEVLGLGFVHGVQPHVYLERLDLDALQKMGLSLNDSDRHSDLSIRIPPNKESVFRASVFRNGLPVCDILQVWLDASTFPARGIEQAKEIQRRVLKPLFEKRS